MVGSKNHWEDGHHIQGFDGKRMKSVKQGTDGGPFTAVIELFDEGQAFSHH